MKHNFKEVVDCGKLFDCTGRPNKYFRECYYCGADERDKKLYDVHDDCVCNECIEREVLTGNYIPRD